MEHYRILILTFGNQQDWLVPLTTSGIAYIIDWPITTDGAINMYCEARKKHSYDAIIIDRRGEEPCEIVAGFDRICEMLAELPSPKEPIVYHVGLGIDSELLRQHMVSHHLNDGIMPHIPARVFEAHQIDEVVPQLCQYLSERTVLREMADLFGGRKSDEKCMTHPLARVQRVIIEAWPYLGDKVKEEVGSHFHVDDSQLPIRISLIGKP